MSVVGSCPKKSYGSSERSGKLRRGEVGGVGGGGPERIDPKRAGVTGGGGGGGGNGGDPE